MTVQFLNFASDLLNFQELFHNYQTYTHFQTVIQENHFLKDGQDMLHKSNTKPYKIPHLQISQKP